MVRIKLEQVGLSGFENYSPAQLSGGMKKRAAFARAMALDPEILFFDEPSAGLDPITAAGIDDLILSLKKAYALSMVVVTHELASAFLIADRMILIDRGNIVAMGPVGRSAEQPASAGPPVSGPRCGYHPGRRSGPSANVHGRDQVRRWKRRASALWSGCSF